MFKEFLQRLMDDKEFAEKIFDLNTPEEVREALKVEGYDISIDEIKQIAKELSSDGDNELCEDVLENVAGGIVRWRPLGWPPFRPGKPGWPRVW